MNDGLMEDCREIRRLGDCKAGDTRQQAAIAGKYWGDPRSLSAMADALEASEQWVRKLAGAGAVMGADLWPEDQSLEWAYQLSLFPTEEWEEVADLALIGGLDASGLGKLRRIIGNMTGVERHFCLCRGCEHGSARADERSRCNDCEEPISEGAQRCKACAARRRWSQDVYYGIREPSSLEREVAAELDRLGVEHVREYRPPGYVRGGAFDFYVPSRHLLLEVDGHRWHETERARERGKVAADEAKTAWARQNGYRLEQLRREDMERRGVRACLMTLLYEQLQLP